jgi:aspartate aminotransferase-like enzyme
VPLPPDVLKVLAEPMIHHRTPEFEEIFKRVLNNLKKVFLTTQPVFIHTSTGSGAMESALVNTLSPGDEILCVISGKFGERWAEMAQSFDLKIHRLNVTWGEPLKVSDVQKLLHTHPQIKAVLTQACETSTGVVHPIQELSEVVSKTPALLMVDAITALGALPLPMDDWKLDIVIGGSQKAFMLPTGLSFIALSERAWKLTETARCPRFYFDLRREKKANDSGESFFSTAVAHIKALDAVLNWMMSQGGLAVIQNRIKDLSEATQAACQELGLKVFARTPSPSLTAIAMPEFIDGQKVRAEMEKTHRVTVMGGQDQLKGKVIRMGHMGFISNEDLHEGLKALVASINSQKAGTISAEQMQRAWQAAESFLK